MPRGFSSIKQAAERIDKQTSDYPNVLLFKLLDDGDEAVVRFLEQGDEVYNYWYHDFSHVDPTNGWKTAIPCLDQEDNAEPCPGCEQGLPRKFKGLINLIWRDAPIFKRDSEGKVVKKKNGEYVVEGYEDQVAVWRGGIKLFSKVLARKDVKYKGLCSRDFEVTREGQRGDNQTTYSVEPADIDAKASKLSKADQELADNKYDLEEVARFVDYETFEKIINKKLGDADESSNGEATDKEELKGFLKDDPFDKD